MNLRDCQCAAWSAFPPRLLGFPTLLFSRAFACQRLLGPAFVARLQVERVLLDVLDDIFLLHLALETPQRAFDRLAVLHLDFSQNCLSPPLGGARHDSDGPRPSAGPPGARLGLCHRNLDPRGLPVMRPQIAAPHRLSPRPISSNRHPAVAETCSMEFVRGASPHATARALLKPTRGKTCIIGRGPAACQNSRAARRNHPTLRHRRAQAESWRGPGLRTCGIVGPARRRPVGKTVATPRIGGVTRSQRGMLLATRGARQILRLWRHGTSGDGHAGLRRRRAPRFT